MIRKAMMIKSWIFALAMPAFAFSSSAHLMIEPPGFEGNGNPISSRDRIFTGDQSSNTITVVDPSNYDVLGTIALGDERLGSDLGPQYVETVNSHGMGFSRDGKYIVSLSVLSNTITVVSTSNYSIVTKSYVDRGPHEAFFGPDNRTIWTGTRGVSTVELTDGLTSDFVDRIFTAAGPSKVVFSGNGSIAYVNHIFDAILTVIDVPSRKVMYNITGLADTFSSDMMISPDSGTIWTAHKLVGKCSVIDLAARKVRAIIDTGTETNHPNFAIINGTQHVFVTVAAINATRVYRQPRAEDIPVLVKTIPVGIQPHPLWPSPDNTRMYVANQHSDTISVIDTNRLEVIHTMNSSQDTQSLVYVSRVIPEGVDDTANLQNLGKQGLNLRVDNRLIPVNSSHPYAQIQPNPYGNESQALITIRETNGLDMFQIIGRDLVPNGTYTASALCHTCTEEQRTPILTFKASALTNKVPGCGGNEQVLGFLKFFESYSIDSIKIEPGEGSI